MTKYEVLIYTKTIKTKDGKSFPKYLLRIGDKVIDCNIETETRKKLEGEAVSKGIKYPYKVVLEDSNYFIKTTKVATKYGEVKDVKKCAVLGYQELTQGEFPQGETLADALGD